MQRDERYTIAQPSSGGQRERSRAVLVMRLEALLANRQDIVRQLQYLSRSGDDNTQSRVLALLNELQHLSTEVGRVLCELEALDPPEGPCLGTYERTPTS